MADDLLLMKSDLDALQKRWREAGLDDTLPSAAAAKVHALKAAKKGPSEVP